MSGTTKLYPHDDKMRVERKKTRLSLPNYFDLFLKLLPMFAGLFAAWAMLNLHLEITYVVIGKAVLIGIVVAIVSYAINRFAIDWGTELAANGYLIAGFFSVLSMMLVAGCLWFFSFGGIVLPDVRVLRFEDHGAALSQNLQMRQEQATKAMRIAPIIAAARDDFAFHGACERANGCVSGRGGGNGTLSRVLDERSRRAGSIAEQLSKGRQEFASIIAQANDVLGEYQSVLNDDALSLKKRRQELIRLDGKFISIMSALEEAFPLALIGVYAQELLDGLVIPNRADATHAMNVLLKKHGTALKSVLDGIEHEVVERTQFPNKAGLSDTLSYVGNFAPLSGVIWVAEGIFPLALWIYTLFFLIRQRERNEPISDLDHISVVNSTNSAADNSKPSKRRRSRKPHTGNKTETDNTAQHLNGSTSKTNLHTRSSQSIDQEELR